jgi:hypothetical protein
MRVGSHTLGRGLARWLTDFALALSLFWFAVFAFGGPHNHAHAIPLPMRASQGGHPTALNVHLGSRSTANFALCANLKSHTRAR